MATKGETTRQTYRRDFWTGRRLKGVKVSQEPGEVPPDEWDQVLKSDQTSGHTTILTGAQASAEAREKKEE